VKVSGVTVHLVDEGVDTGPVVAQAAVPVLDGDDEAALQAGSRRWSARSTSTPSDGWPAGLDRRGEDRPMDSDVAAGRRCAGRS
jgi:hypothetical protein